MKCIWNTHDHILPRVGTSQKFDAISAEMFMNPEVDQHIDQHTYAPRAKRSFIVGNPPGLRTDHGCQTNLCTSPLYWSRERSGLFVIVAYSSPCDKYRELKEEADSYRCLEAGCSQGVC